MIAVAFAALWLSTAPAAAQGGPDFPPLTGRIVDNANLLSPEAERSLTTRLEALERDTTDQLVIVTVPDLEGYEIEEYGYRLGREWQVGQADRNNGVLLIVAPTERKVRIEVGYGLEPVLTDALSALIIHDQILPSFRQGRFERGIVQGVDAIDEQLRLDPEAARARAEAADHPPSRAPIGPAILITVVFVLLALSIIGGVAGRGRRRRGRRRNGVSPALIWAASEIASSRKWGGRSGGGFGGGFSGGGGSFGGGGASGGW
ncbi:hypothetical protein GCM10009422_22950 [Brevundimonas kwangchunensis]|uniref:TPM domain-containing protein n=1 Tax=Brevundimonas kwangchunensis TaxID=322163 RepID=A0ABP3S8L5_9CAUL